MTKRIGIVAALALLFIVANRGAYRSFFFGDDLDNLAWTRSVPAERFVKALASPVYTANNFRPTGHGLYQVWHRAFGLQFPRYAATIQLLHLLNAFLLFWLLRRVGAGEWQAAVAAVMWVFHMALFGAFWRPMYVFDVLCGLFVLLSLLAWTGQRWVLSFICFWLAMKSKEHAVLLPAVLLLYEWTIGQRRWKPLLPFLAASIGVGVQGLFANRAAGADYKLVFQPSSVVSTAWAYTKNFWFVAPFFVVCARREDKGIWWGLGWLALLLAPMLILPGRINPVYLYVPLMGLAAALGMLMTTYGKPAWVAGFTVAWLALNFAWMRELRRAELTYAGSNRAYFEQLSQAGPSLAEPELYIYDGYPEGLQWWGISGAVRLITGKAEARMAPVQAEDLLAQTEGKQVMQLFWEPVQRRLTTHVRSASRPELARLDMKDYVPFWQLEEGWYKQESGYRWIKPHALVALQRPAGATRFELRVNIGPGHIAAVKPIRVSVRLDGEVLGEAVFDKQGWQTVGWTLAPKPAARVHAVLDVTPPFHPGPSDPRALGVAVGSIGYLGSPR